MKTRPILILVLLACLPAACQCKGPERTQVQPAGPMSEQKTVVKKPPVKRVPAKEPVKPEICYICRRSLNPKKGYGYSERGHRWHMACARGRQRCGITGLPIPRNKMITLRGNTFYEDDYHRAEKCAVSGLPLVNQGKYKINSRSGTKVLAKFVQFTKRCVSCGDRTQEGIVVNKRRFSCQYCADSYNSYKRNPEKFLVDVQAFFRKRGLATPPIQLKISGFEAGLSETTKGLCKTKSVTVRGKTTYSHTIYILSHLSQEIFRAVLAHEYMHAVIARSGKEFSDKEAEGLCELTSYFYCLSRKAPKYVVETITKNEVTLYREGFEMMKGRYMELKDHLK